MKKYASRSAQEALTAQHTFSFNEWSVDSVSGVKTTYGSTVATSTDPTEAGLVAGTGIVFDCIPLPVGAVVIGGEVIVEEAYVGVGVGATLTVGIAGNTACYLAALDLDAAAAGSRTPLLLTSALASNNGQNVRMTTAGLTATATAGKVRIRVTYTIDGRTTEVQIS